jgi:oligopeptide transport system substrate-binding protein
MLSGCKRPADPAKPPQILRLSQRNEPSDLDPATSSLPDEFFIIRALSEGLLVPGADGGSPQPAAAERWEISPDGLTYTFHLRSAQWSNGEPVTAEDFLASYQRLLTPATAAPKAHLFFAVKNARAFASGGLTDFAAVGFRAVDASTLVITLERPVPGFPLYVASGPWIPVNPRTVARHGRQWTRPENFVGNGAFTLVEWRPHQRIVVRKNPAYRAAAQSRPGEIHFVAFDDSEAEERAYRAGQIDVTMAVPASKLDVYAREQPADLHRTLLAETRYLSFNTRRPPLDDPQVRRALALAIDRAKIVERVRRGGQQPAFRFVPPALRDAGEKNPPTWPLTFDPAEARRLLVNAGFAGGKGFPRLELTGWAQTPVLEALQAMWRQELGIEVGIAVREARVHLAALGAGDYDIAFITQIPDVADPFDMLTDFASSAPGNYPHWSDARYDALLAEAVAARDTRRQSVLLTEAEQRLIESCVVAPVYFNAKNWLMSPRVRGWKEDALWSRDYGSVYLAEP